MKSSLLSIIAALVLVVLLSLLTDPFMLWMPAPAQMAVLLGAAVLAAVWAGLVLKEKAHDEREALHTMHAGRVAYLAGLALLTFALLVQGFSHAIDPWVPFTLGAMVVAKVAARFYLERYK